MDDVVSREDRGMPVEGGQQPSLDRPDRASTEPPPSAVAPASTCPACHSGTTPGARFCEACGHELEPGAATDTAAGGVAGPAPVTADDASPLDSVRVSPPAAPCASCGGVVADDGYCQTCGTPAARPRDHFREAPAAWVAGVCDRGLRHHRNEDAMALAADETPSTRAVLVVCDGVSSSTDSDRASLAAARAARDLLSASRPQGVGTTPARVSATAAVLESAVADANAAVVAATVDPDGHSPASCTFVAAVLDRELLVVGWVGDSRAYWLPDSGPGVALTVDDSWAAEQIAQGMARHDAESAPQAHAITRWLGVDAPDHAPRIATRELTGAGWVLVCSDGLWNYCSEAADLAVLVQDMAGTAASVPPAAATGAVGPAPDPMPLAEALVSWANEQGGHDNITVALARVGSP